MGGLTSGFGGGMAPGFGGGLMGGLGSGLMGGGFGLSGGGMGDTIGVGGDMPSAIVPILAFNDQGITDPSLRATTRLAQLTQHTAQAHTRTQQAARNFVRPSTRRLVSLAAYDFGNRNADAALADLGCEILENVGRPGSEGEAATNAVRAILDTLRERAMDGMRQAGRRSIFYTAAESRTAAFDSAFHRAFPLMRGEANAAGEFRAAIEAGSQDSERAYRPFNRASSRDPSLYARDLDRVLDDRDRDWDRGGERRRGDDQRGRERGRERSRDRSPQRGRSPIRDRGERTTRFIVRPGATSPPRARRSPGTPADASSQHSPAATAPASEPTPSDVDREAWALLSPRQRRRRSARARNHAPAPTPAALAESTWESGTERSSL